MDNLPVNKLEEIAIKIDAHGKVAIENIISVGKLLCQARDIFPANQKFGEWREDRLPWINRRLANMWMNAWKNGGENLLGNNFPTAVVYELTAPSVPESARDSAEQEEKLTVKQAKELAKAHKRLEELSNKKPDKNNLIPDLLKKYKGSSITPGVADRLSVLDEDSQKLYLTLFESKWFAENQQSRAAEEKLKALENLNEITKERDEALAALNDSESAIAVKKVKDEYAEKLFHERNRIKKEAAETFERLNKDKISELENDKNSLEKKLARQKRRAELLGEESIVQQGRAEAAEKQLASSHPAEKDTQHARTVKFIITNLEKTIKDIESDCLFSEREQINKQIQTLIEVAQRYLSADHNIIEIEEHNNG